MTEKETRANEQDDLSMSKHGTRPKQQDFVANASLEKAPEFAEALGHLCAAWSSLEFQMMRMFQAVSGAPIAISRTIFYSIKTN